MSEKSTSLLMDAVATLTDWRLVRTFSCEVIVQDPGEEPQSLELHAEPMHSSYVLVDPRTGRRQSYDDTTRSFGTDGQIVQRQASALLTEPLPVRLAFPMSLPIWGRRHDLYRMVDANRVGSLLTVSLTGRADASLSGTLTIDLNRGLAVRIYAPTLQVEYRGIVPARSRFGVSSL